MIEQRLYQSIRELIVQLQYGGTEALRPFRLTVIQFDTLRILSETEGQRMGVLCTRLLIDNSKMTRIIDALEKRNLAQRRPDPDDRRALAVFLTPQGVALREKAAAVHKQFLQSQFAILSNTDKQQLDALLTKVKSHTGPNNE